MLYSEYRKATNRQANVLLSIIVMIVFVLLIWAYKAEVDEVTTAQGRVIPSSQVQVVQNLEGGIVKEIFVRPNQIVEKDEILLRIDDTGFASSFEEKRERYYSLQVKIARLQAEVEGLAPVFSVDAIQNAQQYVANEVKLYYAKQDELDSSLNILKQKIDQKEVEAKNLEVSKEKTEGSLKLLEEELEMTTPLVRKRIVPEVDLLKLRREISDVKRDVNEMELSILAAQAQQREQEERIQEYINAFQRKNIEELSALKDEYAQLSAIIKASRDRVDRTAVRSPVRGTVKQLMVNTLGGVVKPGMDLVEIIPLEDTLKVEAEVKPKDIAFLRPDQKVLVKISAYDFSIYGGLDAKLERISVDSIKNDKDEQVYRIIVRTDKNQLGTEDNPLPIIPGMVADVNIVTGRKTVLDYILKPILKAKNNALRER